MRITKIKKMVLTSTALLASLLFQPAYAAQGINFQIKAKSLANALRDFGLQSGQDVLFSSAMVEGKSASAIIGEYTPEEGLARLLKNSGLVFHKTENGTWMIKESKAEEEKTYEPLTKDDPGYKEAKQKKKDSNKFIETITVSGSRNTAIRRLESDPLPFVVFDRDQLVKSNSNSIGEFLTRNLNSNTSANGATANINGGLASRGRSNVALRGLSDRETLILIDGRRIAENRRSNGSISQPDINGIPMAAVERIEILPSSASGIYGGGATGGVINIILKRDYQGFTVGVTHDTTSRFDYSDTRVDFSGGTSLGERTSLSFSASLRDGTELEVAERNFLETARNIALVNNPDALLSSALLSSTSNIVSPFSFLGAGPELTLVSGGELGSRATHIPVGYAGITSDNGAALITNSGSFNLAPSDTAQRGGGGNLLTSTPKSISFIGSINHEFSDKLTIFGETSYSKNETSTPANAATTAFFVPGGTPGNPFNENISVSVPVRSTFQLESEIETTRLATGFTYQLGEGDWYLSSDLTWDRTVSEDKAAPLFDNSGFAAAIASGTVNPFADTDSIDFSGFFFDEVSSESPSETTLTTLAVRLGGDLPFSLPGGQISVNMTGEYRDENYDSVTAEQIAFNFRGVLEKTDVFTPEQNQKVVSFYAEALFPLVSSNTPGLHSLDLQIAARFDSYDIDSALRSSTSDLNFVPGTPFERNKVDFSETTPTIALKYEPVEGVILRGSYAEGFLPPSVLSLSPLPSPNFTGAFFFEFFGTGDPLRGGEILGSNNGLGGIDVFGGGSPDLKPERTKSHSLGLIIEPNIIDGLRVSVDWTKIEKTDAIATLVSFDPNDAADIITLRPDRVTRAEPAPDDPFSVGPIIALSSRLLNFASQTVEALDFSVDYLFPTKDIGVFAFGADVTRNLENDNQLTPSADIKSNAGFVDFIKTRATASLDWDKNAWSAKWAMQYYSGYEIDPDGFGNAGIIVTQGSGSIESQIYHDLIFSYNFDDAGQWQDTLLENTRFELAAYNIFDKAPPFDATQLNTTGISVFGDPRLSRFRLSLTKTF